jgi:WD40 repeat protein
VLAFSPDGKLLFGGGGTEHRGCLTEWDTKSGTVRRTISTGDHGPVRAIALSGDGMRLASGAYLGGVKIWNRERGGLERTLPGGFSLAFAYSHAEKVALAIDEHVEWISVQTGKATRTLP